MADGYSNFVNNGFGKKLAKQLGLPQPPVLRRYEVGQALLDGPAAVAELGWDEALREGVVLAEWPERLGPLRPGNALEIALEPHGEGQRIATLSGWPEGRL